MVRTTVATTIRAPRDRAATLFADPESWPRLFPATIASVEIVQRDGASALVIVQHRREGRVPNRLWICAPGVVVLWERKARYDATFVNHFDHVPDGTRLRVEAEVRFRWPYALLAPLLHGVVERALRRSTVEPLRIAVERDDGGVRTTNRR